MSERVEIFECLACGHVFPARDHGGRETRRRCSKCWSPDVFSTGEIERLVGIATAVVAAYDSFFPIFDVLATIFTEQKIVLRPLTRFRLTRRVWRGVLERLGRT